MTYFNTTNEHSEELKLRRSRTNSQEIIILGLFQEECSPLSPSRVDRILNHMGYNWPLTSIRRAITDLTNNGKLEKTTEKEIGTYGAKEFLWAVRQDIAA